MTESAFLKIVLALMGLVSAFFWFVINGLKNSDSEAHKRIDVVNDKITGQAKYNSETYARRDDVVQMKIEILDAISELKKEIKK